MRIFAKSQQAISTIQICVLVLETACATSELRMCSSSRNRVRLHNSDVFICAKLPGSFVQSI